MKDRILERFIASTNTDKFSWVFKPHLKKEIHKIINNWGFPKHPVLFSDFLSQASLPADISSLENLEGSTISSCPVGTARVAVSHELDGVCSSKRMALTWSMSSSKRMSKMENHAQTFLCKNRLITKDVNNSHACF